MTTLYMLCYYEEHGPKDISITDNRDDLPDILRAYIENSLSHAANEYYVEKIMALDIKYRAELTRRLALSDDELDREHPDLLDGWGGLQLHVLKLWGEQK